MMLDEWTDAVRDAERRIEHGWYAALCAIVLRGSVGGLVAVSAAGNFVSHLPYLAALVGLAIGVARKSRAAAAALLLQELWIDGGLAWRQRSVLVGALLLGLGYFYASSLVGTIRYHRLQHERPDPLTGMPVGVRAS